MWLDFTALIPSFPLQIIRFLCERKLVLFCVKLLGMTIIWKEKIPTFYLHWRTSFCKQACFIDTSLSSEPHTKWSQFIKLWISMKSGHTLLQSQTYCNNEVIDCLKALTIALCIWFCTFIFVTLKGQVTSMQCIVMSLSRARILSENS